MSLNLYDLAGAQPERRFSPYCWKICMALAHKQREEDILAAKALADS